MNGHDERLALRREEMVGKAMSLHLVDRFDERGEVVHVQVEGVNLALPTNRAYELLLQLLLASGEFVQGPKN